MRKESFLKGFRIFATWAMLFFLAANVGVADASGGIYVNSVESNVYICITSKAYRYHSTISCRGLRHCGKCIRKVSLQQAVNMGRTPCKICY